MISFAMIGFIAIPAGKYFHEWAFAGILAASIVSIVRAVKSDVQTDKKTSFLDGIMIFFTSVICTTVFWYKAWLHLPAGILVEPIFDMITGFGFWWPGVLYASLHRHMDEHWSPASRSRYIQNIAIGFGGSVIGLLAVYIMLQTM